MGLPPTAPESEEGAGSSSGPTLVPLPVHFVVDWGSGAQGVRLRGPQPSLLSPRPTM